MVPPRGRAFQGALALVERSDPLVVVGVFSHRFEIGVGEQTFVSQD